MTVCKTLDKYVNQYGDNNPIWIAMLSNGETIYQDDDRPNVEPQSAWLRLKSYCEDNDVHIVKMQIKNRSHMLEVGSECDGFFFCKVAGSYMFGNETHHAFSIGTLENGRLRVRKWNLPSLEPDRFEDRDPYQVGDMLICKKGILDEQKL